MLTFTLFVISMNNFFEFHLFFWRLYFLYYAYLLYRNWYFLTEKRDKTWYDRGQENWNISISWEIKKTFSSTIALKIAFILSRFVKLNDIVKMKVQSRTSICFVASIILAVTFSNVVDAASTQPRCTDDELVNFLIF